MCTFPDAALRLAFGPACLRKSSPSLMGSGQQAHALGWDVKLRPAPQGKGSAERAESRCWGGSAVEEGPGARGGRGRRSGRRGEGEEGL